MSVIKAERKPLEFADRPLLADALAVWQGWAGDAAAPAWRDVDLMQLPAKLLPTTVVVDVVDGGDDYVYRFWGTGMRDLYTVDETGKRLSRSMQPQFIAITFRQLAEVRDSGAPVHYHITMRQPNGIAARKINLRLPVVDDGGGAVSKIITVSEVEPLNMNLGDDLGELWKRPLELE